MVVETIKKKREEKGIGYVIEAFVAAIVLFIFAFSHHAEAPQDRDWNNFQDQVSANDLTYVMQKTGHTDKMVKRGQTGSIQTAFSALTENRMSISGTIENTPIGNSRVGFYTDSSDIITEELVEVTSGDPCHDHFQDVESEYPVLRTQDNAGSLENLHGVRLYLADMDPTHPVDQNNQKDYDTLWVDNGTTCSFTASEGPHITDSYFSWGNETDSNPDTVYDFKRVTKDDELVVYNASVPGRLKKEIGRSSNTLNVRTTFDSFNFSKENLNYDLIIFQSKSNLNTLNANSERMLEYQEEGSLLLMMDLKENDLETGFLNKTGLKWMNIDRDPSGTKTKFTDSFESEKTREYFKNLQCAECDMELQLGGTISSSNGEYLTQGGKLLVGSNTLYETEKWSSAQDSMADVSDVPEGLPQNECGTATRSDFDLPSKDGAESLTVYNVPLGSGDTCAGLRGVGIDLDDDGDFNEDDESIYFSEDKIKINNRLYRVEIKSEDEVSFVFNGDNRVEFVNYRKEFPNSSIDRFARMSDISDGGLEESETKIASSVILWLLEDDHSFGDSGSTSMQTTSIGGIKSDAYLPYKMHLRWSN